MGELIIMQHRTTDLSHRHVASPSDTEVVKVQYSSKSLNTLDTIEGDTLVPNSNRTVYNKGTGRIIVKHLRERNVELTDEVGGETIMSEQLDRQKIQEMIEKELRSQEKQFELKLETMSTKLDSGLKDVESKLSQKIETMNFTLLQALQEIKGENSLIKKEIEVQSLATQSSISQSFNTTKDLINTEKENARNERKADQKFLMTIIVSTSGVIIGLAAAILKFVI